MCALFGVIDYSHNLTAKYKTKIVTVLAQTCEARGKDATGIAYNSGGRLNIYKRPLAPKGCTQDEIGVAVGMSQKGVSKRIARLKKFF